MKIYVTLVGQQKGRRITDRRPRGMYYGSPRIIRYEHGSINCALYVLNFELRRFNAKIGLLSYQ